MTPEELHNIFRTEAGFWWYRGMRSITDSFLKPLHVPRGSKTLDAGCGSGFNALDLEHRYGLQCYGVDVAGLAIEYCRQRNFRRSVVGSAMQLPFGDNFFDMVVSMDVLSHLPAGEDDRALSEFVRVLRPGGWILLRVPAFPAMRSRHSQWIAEQHRYRDAELRRKLLSLNCRIVRSTYANVFLSPIAMLKFRVIEPLWRSAPRSGVSKIPPAWLNLALTTILKLEAALIRSGLCFPFGQSLLVLATKPAAVPPPAA